MFNDMIYGNSSSSDNHNMMGGYSSGSPHHHPHRHSPGHRQSLDGLTIVIEDEEKHDEVVIKVMSVLEDGNETLTSDNGTLFDLPALPWDKSELFLPKEDVAKNKNSKAHYPKNSATDESDMSEDKIVGGDVLESIGMPGDFGHDYDYHGGDAGYNAEICPYPTYHSYFTVLVLLGATLLAQVRLIYWVWVKDSI